MTESKRQSVQLQPRKATSRALPEEARQLFDAGTAAFEAGRFAEAVTGLRAAAEIAPSHARIRSLLGVSIAHLDRDFQQARSLCESAAKQEFFNPDLYLNLACIHLLFGFRAEAIRYLRRGQMIDPGHARITAELARLGMRGTPIVPFLPRKHPINRALGGARSLIRSSLSRRHAA